MRVPVWAHDLARTFWTLPTMPATLRERVFPRDLRTASQEALFLTVKGIAGLSLTSAFAWLSQNGLMTPPLTVERRVHGLLYTAADAPVLFYDSNDTEAEVRFTLAHELAHYLRDYWKPRQQLAHSIGVAALDVLDGKRAPSSDERLGAVLAGLPLDVHVHLLDRDWAGHPVHPDDADAEARADRLAYELLAPVEELAAAGLASASLRDMTETLVAAYGLPRPQASAYARLLRGSRHVQDPLILSLSRLVPERRGKA